VRYVQTGPDEETGSLEYSSRSFSESNPHQSSDFDGQGYEEDYDHNVRGDETYGNS
jgi:hypothetical protein